MTRPRKNKTDNWLPSRVYRGKSAYEWRPSGMKCVALLPLSRVDGVIHEPPEVKRQVLEAYEKASAVVKQVRDINYWLPRFFLSNRYLRLGALTQADYRRYCDVVAKPGKPETRNGVAHVFGKMLPADVHPYHIRKYMDYWEKAGKKTTANRHLSFLQIFFGWVREQNAGVKMNPARGVTKFREKPRHYLVTDDEYDKLIAAALKSSTPFVAPFIEITYLCGLRRHEALALNLEDITAEGLVIRRGKGSKGEITTISPRLQAAIDLAISLHKPEAAVPIKDRPLLRNTRGLRITPSAINQAFTSVRESCGLGHIWLHDFKKKAGTDGKDLGHKTQAMRDLYDLSVAIKAPTK